MKGFFRDILKVILVVGGLLGVLLILILMQLSGFWTKGGGETVPPGPAAAVSATGTGEGASPLVAGREEGEGRILSRQFLIWVLGEPDASPAGPPPSQAAP